MEIDYMQIIFYLMLLIAFQGCGSESRSNGEIVLEGNRKFSYEIPQKGTIPLIIALHGGGDTVKSFKKYSKFSELSKEKQTFGVIYPEAKEKHWNDGRAIQDNTIDDVQFLEDIITYYKEKGYIEFYLVGISNGGLMALRMAGELNDDISGIAVVSAIESDFSDVTYTDNKSMKVLFVLGTLDTVFLPTGKITDPIKQTEDRGTHITKEVMLEKWRLRNNCDSLKEIETIDTITDDNTTVNYHKGLNCTASLGYYQVNGGGHRWPEPNASNTLLIVNKLNLGFASHEISTAQKCIDFFGIN
jgi:polyhydroxybutyrate depolymerase